jgi:VWFA-related protein
VRLVVLRASVRDKKGAILTGLRESNFNIVENGRPQHIGAFNFEDAPVAAGLVVDNSGSMKSKQRDVIAAAVEFARTSNPDDEMFVINFNERTAFGLADTKLFSASSADLERALLTPVPAGRTALYDAIGSALVDLRKSNLERKVLVVMSDGGDNASIRTFKQVLQDVAQSDVTIYMVGFFDEDDPDRNRRVLRQIASASGGEAFLPKSSAEAVTICRRIAKDIRSRYTISYSPSNQVFDGKYRDIRVTATGQRGEKLQVRTRAGYLAPPGQTGR